MKKQSIRISEARAKLQAQKRMRQFGIFVVAIIPIIVGLTLVFGAASLGAAAQVGIDIAIIISGFAIYFFLIIMPLEKWQAKKRAQRIKAEEERVKADGE